MKKGQRVRNWRSGNVGELVHGHLQDPPFHMRCAAVYAVKLDNGQYRYWDYNNVEPFEGWHIHNMINN